MQSTTGVYYSGRRKLTGREQPPRLILGHIFEIDVAPHAGDIDDVFRPAAFTVAGTHGEVKILPEVLLAELGCAFQ
jgi:hypothetical protein